MRADPFTWEGEGITAFVRCWLERANSRMADQATRMGSGTDGIPVVRLSAFSSQQRNASENIWLT